MRDKTLKGFTLLEILIVIVIIGIAATTVMFTITPNQRKQSENLSQQLINLITLAEQEALLRPATLGLGFNKNSWQFYEFKPKEKNHKSTWVTLTTSPLNPRNLPNNLQVRVKLNNEIAAAQPQIIISPSGDVSPFIILIGPIGKTPFYQISETNNGELKSEIFHEE